MQFLIIAYDHKNGGLQRRMEVREKHIKLGDQMRAEGSYLMGVALLDENNQMMGSAKIVEFQSKRELKKYLKSEPYVTNNVWDSIEIIPCKVGPTFTK